MGTTTYATPATYTTYGSYSYPSGYVSSGYGYSYGYSAPMYSGYTGYSYGYSSPAYSGYTGTSSYGYSYPSTSYGYGGGYAVFTVASLRPGDYEYSLIPRSVAALYATYTSNDLSWGRFGATAGVKYVSKTSGTVPGAVVYPRYALVDASAFVSHGSWTASLNVDNLFDKLYFTPMTDVYTNVSVLPGMGRQWRVALQRRF